MSKSVKTREPPCTERYARWCERSAGHCPPPTRLAARLPTGRRGTEGRGLLGSIIILLLRGPVLLFWGLGSLFGSSGVFHRGLPIFLYILFIVIFGRNRCFRAIYPCFHRWLGSGSGSLGSWCQYGTKAADDGNGSYKRSKAFLHGYSFHTDHVLSVTSTYRHSIAGKHERKMKEVLIARFYLKSF